MPVHPAQHQMKNVNRRHIVQALFGSPNDPRHHKRTVSRNSVQCTTSGFNRRIVGEGDNRKIAADTVPWKGGEDEGYDGNVPFAEAETESTRFE